MRISEATRRDIFDGLRVQGVNWAGRLDETTFLARIFDLERMPSYDGRFTSASGDIWQHRINNYDWDDDWVFSDSRFDLLRCDDEVFLHFLCEIIHPVVRADPQEIDTLVSLFNEILAADGYEIVEQSRMSGRPIFAGQHKIVGAPPPAAWAKDMPAFTYGILAQQLDRIEAAIPDDPDLAIGTSKELVEACCKTILFERGVPFDDGWDLSHLVKATYKELKLTPDDIPDSAKASDVMKRLLSNLATVTQGLAELRNKYGTGHGRRAASKGLRPRHARLAAGAAITLATFLFETHAERAMESTSVAVAEKR